jgi:hypothetical protein
MDTPERAPGQTGPDPLVRRCERDVRPTDYAEPFARAARQLLIGDVAPRPAWLQAVFDGASVQRLRTAGRSAPQDALAALSAA